VPLAQFNSTSSFLPASPFPDPRAHSYTLSSSLSPSTEKTRLTNPHRLRAKAAHQASLAPSSSTNGAGPSSSTLDAPAPPPKRLPIQMPDEYLPPNSTLFIQGLVEGATKEILEEVFGRSVYLLFSVSLLSRLTNEQRKRTRADLSCVCSRFALCRYPNLVSVRMIPAKKDIAFVDFGDEASSTLAKEALNGYKIGEGDEAAPMKVSKSSTTHPSSSLPSTSNLPSSRSSTLPTLRARFGKFARS